MIARQTGFVAAAALAVGLALGFGGSALAANPTATPGYPSMMSGRGMMGGGGYGPGMMSGASFGPGVMGSFSPEQIQRCDEIHDAMHAAASRSGSSSPR